MMLYHQPVGLRAGLCPAVAAATALALAAAGCSYQSTYVAPADGRARVVWGAGDVPVVDLSGAELSGECSAELRNVTEPGRPSRNHGELSAAPPTVIYVSGGSSYWRPRYYGPPIIVARPGAAPPFAHAPVFVPRPAFPASGHPIGIGSGRIAPTGGGAVRSGGGGGGGGGLGSGKDAGVILVILAVVAISALPVVALGLAASMPESSSKSSSAIDMVNAYNDLSRRDGTPCTPAPYFGPSELVPPQEPPQ